MEKLNDEKDKFGRCSVPERHKLLVIYGMPDHIHVLFGMRPTQSLSDLMRDVKGDSSLWINNNRFVNRELSWQ